MQLVLTSFLYFWLKWSYSFPSPVPQKLFESLLISRSGLAERENGKQYELVVRGIVPKQCSGGQESTSSLLCCNPLSSPHPPNCLSFSKSMLWSIELYSTQQSTKHTASTSTPHLTEQGAPLGRDAQPAIRLPGPEPQKAPSSLPFSLKAVAPMEAPNASSIQHCFTFNLHRHKLTTQGKGESVFFSSQRWSDALFSIVHLLSSKLSVPYEPAAFCLNFPWSGL